LGKAAEPWPILNMQDRASEGLAGLGVPFFRSFLGTQESTNKKYLIRNSDILLCTPKVAFPGFQDEPFCDSAHPCASPFGRLDAVQISCPADL
jgi:hypothetical protein